MFLGAHHGAPISAGDFAQVNFFSKSERVFRTAQSRNCGESISLVFALQILSSGGAVAKWQGNGLQNHYRRFDSASRLQYSPCFAFALPLLLSWNNLHAFLWPWPPQGIPK
jgi:hypothetical protein